MTSRMTCTEIESEPLLRANLHSPPWSYSAPPLPAGLFYFADCSARIRKKAPREAGLSWVAAPIWGDAAPR
jgi:hypothetical protein